MHITRPHHLCGPFYNETTTTVTQWVLPKWKHQFLNQAKLLFTQHLHCFSPFLELKCEELSYFQGNKLSKLSHEQNFSYTQKNKEQVFTRNIRHTCINFKCLKDRKRPLLTECPLCLTALCQFSKCEYTGRMTVLSLSHLPLWVNPVGNSLY